MSTANVTEEQFKVSIRESASALRYTDRFKLLESDIDPALLARFDELSSIDLNEMTLPEAEELEAFTRAIAEQMDVLIAPLIEKILGGGLHIKLEGLLKEHLSLCPLCKGQYDQSREMLIQLLIIGRLNIECSCKGREWGPEAPEMLKEFRALNRWMPKEPAWKGYSSHYDVVRVEVGGVRVASAAIDFSSERIVLFADRNALMTSRGAARSHFVWARLKAEAIKRRTEMFEKQVREGDKFKLEFLWSAKYHNWSSHVSVDGILITYVIRADYENGMTEGWWYCSKASVRGSKLVFVIPAAPVPSHHTPPTLKQLDRPRRNSR